jgi:uncharacterized protein (DUF2252 family)
VQTIEESTIKFSASPDELTAAGKSMRARLPRSEHREWRPPHSRPDPLDILQAADANRLPNLVPIRYARMARSPFAFYRGSAGVMAADLAATPTTGTTVQACGDCHLGNFGGFATPERNLIFDINDFDETLPAPWEWDVKRLAASFVLAARNNHFSKDTALQNAITCARNYRKAMLRYAAFSPLEMWYQRFGAQEFLDEVRDSKRRAAIAARVRKAMSSPSHDAAYPKLASVVAGEIRIRDNPPLIYHPEEARAPEFKDLAERLLKEYSETLADDRRVLLDRYRFVDAAIKVVGVGSIGTRCWIVLLMSGSNDPLFLQFKQAGASVLEQYAGKSAYAHAGQRVVMGQRLMQAASDIFLGWVSGPNAEFYVRQLRDAKVSPAVETSDADLLHAFAKLCGSNLARAHAKGGNAWTIGGYLGKSDEFDEAIGEFSMAYADQAERDHGALRSAIGSGRIEAYVE